MFQFRHDIAAEHHRAAAESHIAAAQAHIDRDHLTAESLAKQAEDYSAGATKRSVSIAQDLEGFSTA